MDLFTSRPVRPVWHRPLAVAFIAATVLGGLVDAIVPVRAATGVVGSVFDDADRDGRRTADELGFADITVHLVTEDRTRLVASATTDAAGRFAMSDVPDGLYELQMGTKSWWKLGDDWTPTTTGSLQPRLTMAVTGGSGEGVLGLRQILRSTDVAAPITSYGAPDGMALRSYNDVVLAQELHEVLLEGSLLGEEAASVTVRHDLSDTTTCSGVASWDGEAYTSYRATCSVSWSYWLTGGHTAIFHEYGHAWSMYHAYVTQQDPDLLGYLHARGIDPDDERIGSSHAWSVREMIAEDYRQLFGSPEAQLAPQENHDIPPAAEVPGLLEYLRDDFTTPPADDGSGEPSAETEPEPEPEPTPPEAPTDLTATDDADGTAVLSWSDQADNEEGFEVMREQQHRNGRWLSPEIVVVTEADVIRLDDAPGPGAFRYTLRAFNDVGVSEEVTTVVEVTDTSSSGGGRCHPKKGC